MENQGHSQAAPLLVHEIGMKCDDGFKLAVELGGQGLVMGQHQGRFLQLLDDIGHGKRLAGAGDAQQSFKSVTFPETLDKGIDRLGLIAGGLVF